MKLCVRGRAYDDRAGIAGCAVPLPCMMMTMPRLNVPSVFIYGGSILPGKVKGRDVTAQDVPEAAEHRDDKEAAAGDPVGLLRAGDMD